MPDNRVRIETVKFATGSGPSQGYEIVNLDGSAIRPLAGLWATRDRAFAEARRRGLEVVSDRGEEVA